MTERLMSLALLAVPILALWMHHRRTKRQEAEDDRHRRAAIRWHEQRRDEDRWRDREAGLTRTQTRRRNQ